MGMMPRFRHTSQVENIKAENIKAENTKGEGRRKKGNQMQHVGLVLRARRREMNMSQASLAEKMQTSQEVISNYENGVTPVRADDLPRFADILAVTSTYFFEPDHRNVAAPQSQPDGVHPAIVQSSAADTGSKAAGESTDQPLTPYRPLKWKTGEIAGANATGRNGEETEASARKYDVADFDEAEQNDEAEYKIAAPEAVPFGAPSGADLEKALLADYRALGPRMRMLAVKLVRELAQDEREAMSRVVVWNPDS